MWWGMKFAFLPKPWTQVVEDLEARGHHLVDLSDNPDMLLFRGGPDDFPDELPASCLLYTSDAADDIALV